VERGRFATFSPALLLAVASREREFPSGFSGYLCRISLFMRVQRNT
jgi:hypothetical protein